MANTARETMIMPPMTNVTPGAEEVSESNIILEDSTKRAATLPVKKSNTVCCAIF